MSASVLRWRLSPPTRRLSGPLIGTAQSIYLPAGPVSFAATVIGGMTQAGKARIYARGVRLTLVRHG